MSSSPSPTTGLRQLSLESMPPTTRSQAHRLAAEAGAGAPTAEYHDESDAESELDDSDTDNIVRSPFTGLMYDISRLPTGDSTQESGGSEQAACRADFPDQDRDIQGRVRELFRKLRRYETPAINLDFCGLGEQDGGEFYAFQLREITPLSIRIGTPTSRWAEPHCSCRNRKPCQHLIWLYDAIAGATLDSYDDDRPLVVDDAGRLPGLEDPFGTIRDFRLDLLTKGLHCAVGSSDAYENTDWFREMEADQILSSFEGFDAEDDRDTYHHQAGQQSGHRGPDVQPSKKRNLGQTVRQLLVQNNEVFSVFLKLLSPRDKARNLYSRLQYRVDAVLEELKRYSRSLRDATLASELAELGADREGRCDVEWASRHIRRAVNQIASELNQAQQQRRQQQHSWEMADAAQTLVYILEKVVLEYGDDMYAGGEPPERNLYQNLIAGGDGLFVVDLLGALLDQTQLAERLEAVTRSVRTKGAPAAFLDRLARVVAGMRLAASRRASSVVTGSPSASSNDGGGGGGVVATGGAPVSQIGAGAGPSTSRAIAGSKRPWVDD